MREDEDEAVGTGDFGRFVASEEETVKREFGVAVVKVWVGAVFDAVVEKEGDKNWLKLT